MTETRQGRSEKSHAYRKYWPDFVSICCLKLREMERQVRRAVELDDLAATDRWLGLMEVWVRRARQTAQAEIDIRAWQHENREQGLAEEPDDDATV